MPDLEEIREEQIRMIQLRVLVDLAAYRLAHKALAREDALALIERTSNHVLALFPDKGEVFELVLRPRFRRILDERARMEWGVTDAVN